MKQCDLVSGLMRWFVRNISLGVRPHLLKMVNTPMQRQVQGVVDDLSMLLSRLNYINVYVMRV